MTGRQVTPRLKSAKKKPKVPTKTQVAKKCDEVFGRIVRSAGACERCHKTLDLQCAHGFSRSYHAVRWDERNAFCLCRGCHVFFTHRPIEWEEWMRDHMNPFDYAELRARALTHRKPDVYETLGRLRGRWAQIESEAA